MNAILGKEFEQLSKRAQERLLQRMYDKLDEELCDAQFIWIKMGCCILHDMGKTESEITQWIGGWKRLYRANSRFATKAEQDAFLDPKMAEIFGEGGFPYEFMHSLRDIGR
jgi:hypothetical protein